MVVVSSWLAARRTHAAIVHAMGEPSGVDGALPFDSGPLAVVMLAVVGTCAVGVLMPVESNCTCTAVAAAVAPLGAAEGAWAGIAFGCSDEAPRAPRVGCTRADTGRDVVGAAVVCTEGGLRDESDGPADGVPAPVVFGCVEPVLGLRMWLRPRPDGPLLSSSDEDCDAGAVVGLVAAGDWGSLCCGAVDVVSGAAVAVHVPALLAGRVKWSV